MILYLVRHADALNIDEAGVSSDADRPLSDKGKENLSKTVAALKRSGVKPNRIISSPYLRAIQTAELLKIGLGLNIKVESCDELSSGRHPNEIIPIIKSFKKTDEVMLVGHEPYLGIFISLLVTGTTSKPLPLKKAGACCIKLKDPDKLGKLHWLLGGQRVARGAAF